MLATLSVPWMCEMSKHSMRAGASGRLSASCNASWIAFDEGFSTRNRASKLCFALVSTRSSSCFFCPRCGVRISTLRWRFSPSSSSSASRSSKSTGTWISAGMYCWSR